MPRTNETAVKAAIDTNLTNVQVNAFIDDASVWVDEYLADKGLSTALLKKIEKFLACHFITLRDPRLRSVKRGDITDTYQRDTRVTEYLQAAAGLDKSGTVADRLMDGKPRVSFRVGAGYDPDITAAP